MGIITNMARQALKSMGYEIYNVRHPTIWHEDGLTTYHNFSFIEDPDFKKAYARAVKANGGHDHHMRWRAHVALWVVRQVVSLPGDFAECGVSTGFLASAIMQRLNWNTLDKRFFLFDTWAGLDERYLSEAEIKSGRLEWYKDADYEKVVANFAEYRNVHLVRGTVPETLGTVDIDRLCYVSLDMNCTAPEIAAAEYFWPRLVPGGMMLLDDYCYAGYEEQHEAFNALRPGSARRFCRCRRGRASS